MAFGPSMPERIGRYEIVLQIARGGMATVYLARAEGHGGFDRYIALKLTAEHLRDDPEFGQHLVDEAKLVAHLRHQNVVPVLDVGEHDLAVFLVMDYVPGDSLGGLFRLAKKNDDPLLPRVGLRILIDALAGLHAAHEHKDEEGKPLRLVHRDFSPQNILVGTDGIARLTDFGIAKAASRASITMAGTMKGKVSYASPEQARGSAIDRRCDVWAAGVIAWEIFAGQKLFPSNERTLLEVVKGPPRRLRSLVPNIPPEIDEIVAQALGFEVEERTPTALAFSRALTAAARPLGLIAEIEEVADYVQRQVAPILEERKSAIADARARRGGAPVSVSSPLSRDTDADTEQKTVPLPSLPDMPLRRTESGNVDILPLAPPPSERRASPSFDRWSSGSHNPSATPAGVETPAGVTPPGVPEAPMIKLTRLLNEKRGLVIGGAAGFAGVVVVLIIVVALASRGPGKKELEAAARASASAMAANSVPVPTTVSVTIPPPSLGDGEPLPTELEVVANAPIARLTLGGRAVEMEVPAPKAEIELMPDETGAAIAVVATSTDGRVANGSWSLGDTELSLAFGDAPAPIATPAAKPRGKPKKTKKH